MTRLSRRLITAIGCFLALIAVSACSGGGSPASAGTPKGGSFTVGFTLPTAQNTTIQAIADGLRAEIEGAGGKLITADSQLSIDKQIADIDTFVTRRVDAIVVFPLDFNTLKSALGRADRAGIPVFAHDALMEGASAESLAPVRSQVVTGRAQQAKEAAEIIAKKTGGSGKVAAIGIAAPVNTNIFLLNQFEARVKEQPGLQYVGQKGNPSDDAAGARPLAEGFLTQYPDLKGIFAYNDPSAVGASTAAAAAGKRGQVFITGFNASQDGLDAVKSGAIDATWDYKPVEIGQTLGRMVLSEREGKKLQPSYTMDVKMVTRDTVQAFVPWNTRVQQIRQGAYLGLPLG